MSTLGQPPWRRERLDRFPGVPAWSLATSRTAPEEFPVSSQAEVSREWAWGGADGSGVRVCVVDTGVDAAHPRIGGLERSLAVTGGPDGGLEVADCDPADPAGHGTACAGVIRSLAPGAALSSVRVLTNGKSGSGAALLAGLRWAIEEGFDLINLSLSTTRTEFRPALHELADRAYFRRCLLVASAHNMPVTSYPWTFSSVISVASHDEPDPMTYYYNPAPPAEFYARGVRVPVAWPGGKEIRSTGNSFAAPHITGICALILSKHRWMTPFQLKSVLYLTARNVGPSNGGAHDRE
ncbi:subtilisin family serine protease [Thermocatellispora tengchongensis]|uniref:Subtilisin family serine protease n=1 Tax=Thermocatellispora tengchongensis TaxID=1073253 RepID=A0A840PB46_9ACTN|nr:S8 family serine peptidase [Thermocatellispora tengchongensis]MBB5134630.1 subtilisin family serine protease [Thermocatellispora tengchongensis]